MKFYSSKTAISKFTRLAPSLTLRSYRSGITLSKRTGLTVLWKPDVVVTGFTSNAYQHLQFATLHIGE